MEGLMILQQDLSLLKDKMTNAQGVEGQFYEVLIQTGKEVIENVEKVSVFRQTMTFHKALDVLLEEMEEYLEEMHDLYSSVIEASYQTIRLKRFFEALDEVMGGIDDFIESVNELFEAQDFNLTYIESWDVGFFIEDM